MVGSVHPVAEGWLVVAAKMSGGSFVPDPPRVFADLARAVEGHPRFDVVGLNAPVGDPEAAKSGSRACDLACRELLGLDPKTARKRATREELRRLMKTRRREARATIGPRHQRTVFEYLPELSLLEMTEGEVADLRGEENLHLAMDALAVLPGVERLLEANVDGITPDDLVRVTLGLWTARRVLARLSVRLPDEPTSLDGFRVEILR
jgi:hypothetical protein